MDVTVQEHTAQCRAQVRRVLAQVAHEPKGRESCPLTEQKPEMGTAGVLDTLGHEAAKGAEGDRALGIVQQAGIQLGRRKDPVGVCSKIPQQAGDALERPDP